ncbi:hypothetical protein [Rhizobiales bacterium 3FA27D7]|jgi:hypothetical protein|uniref:hypothetical protein n=1 Tax=Mesorhizobium sp. 2RAF21 TaxID=3232995 RepID=UPI0010F7B272
MRLNYSHQLIAVFSAFALLGFSPTPSLSKTCSVKCLQKQIGDLKKTVSGLQETVSGLRGDFSNLQDKRVKELEELTSYLKKTLDHTQIKESDNNNICLAHNTPGPGFSTKDCSGGSDEFFVIGSH